MDIGAPLLVVNPGRMLSFLEEVMACVMFNSIPIYV